MVKNLATDAKVARPVSLQKSSCLESLLTALGLFQIYCDIKPPSQVVYFIAVPALEIMARRGTTPRTKRQTDAPWNICNFEMF